MKLARIHARARVGIAAPLVIVETHLSNGIPSMSIVGLPETAVKESRDRVRSAILNSGFDFPQSRIIVNLAPAELPKEGGRFDLAIALAILVASGQVPDAVVDEYEFLGELSLDGDIRPVQGVLPASIASKNAGNALVVPIVNVQEACLPKDSKIIGVTSLLEICSHLSGKQPIDWAVPEIVHESHDSALDMSDVKGQYHAKKALEVAAAGQHNLLFFGPPGTGKTLLASRLPGILPSMTDDEKLQVAAIHSVAGTNSMSWNQRPFRAPHHTASGVALVGGGTNPRPGEISLAHNGVLFLDELAEFPRHVLDVLREPMESGEIVISRAARQVSYPARFQLIAAMNPTPGGYGPNDPRSSHYSPQQIQKYLSRISGPFLDRIDMQVEVSPVPPKILSNTEKGESSFNVRKRILAAVDIQLKRQAKLNALLSPAEVDKYCPLKPDDMDFLHDAMERLSLSARSYHRILKVTRTLADLENTQQPTIRHLSQALGFRQLDKIVT